MIPRFDFNDDNARSSGPFDIIPPIIADGQR